VVSVFVVDLCTFKAAQLFVIFGFWFCFFWAGGAGQHLRMFCDAPLTLSGGELAPKSLWSFGASLFFFLLRCPLARVKV
jgi:hypothetical protein